MGEFALYKGEEIKIGTCEDLYYLRADQRSKVRGYDFTDELRFRFPWPDEDGQAPGGFDPHNRTCPLYGLTAPPELAGKHYRVQFVASAGYLTSLQCPESVPGECGLGPVSVGGLAVHRNGFAGRVLLCQQRLVDGKLVGVVACGGCGMKWRLSPAEAVKAAESLQEEAGKRNSEWYRTVALRLLAGYQGEQS